ncbi:MAG: ribonuclease III domain-containing protein, partial [Planctomycetota bacterium]
MTDQPEAASPPADALNSPSPPADALNSPSPPSATTGDAGFDRRLSECERRIGYRFVDRSLLHASLTHASGADSRLVSNERMEFLGDAILGWVVCEELYHRFPGYLEGDLTRLKSVVVSRRTCAKLSRRLGLEEF